MGVVDGLLKIKRVREDACEQEVRRVRTALDEATAELERIERERRERDNQRLAQETAMVQKLCAAPVNVREIEWTRVDIDSLRQDAEVDRQHEEQARVSREEVRDGLRVAIKARQEATRISEKFVTLAERERQQRLADQERSADLEIEDFKARVLDIEDAQEVA